MALMPNRRTHSAITCVLIPLALIHAPDIVRVISMGLGILSTVPFKVFGTSVYLNPDMDIKSADGLIGKALGLDVYEKSIGHRAGLSKRDWAGILKNPTKVFLFSHIPVLGTVVRYLPVLLLLFIVSFIIPVEIDVYLWWLIGMAVSDTAHVLADLVYSSVRTKRG